MTATALPQFAKLHTLCINWFCEDLIDKRVVISSVLRFQYADENGILIDDIMYMFQNLNILLTENLELNVFTGTSVAQIQEFHVCVWYEEDAVES